MNSVNWFSVSFGIRLNAWWHKQVHPCPRADQYGQARPPADSGLWWGEASVSVRGSVWSHQGRHKLSHCHWNGWSRNIVKMALHYVCHSFFKKWNLNLCDRIGCLFSWMLWSASKPCDVEITWLHCQYLVVCVCEVNCIIALILWKT